MPTGQEIWDRANVYADKPGNAPSDTTLQLALLNDALSELHYMLAEADPDWFHTEQQVSPAVGTESYAFSPNNVYKIKQVYLRDGSKRYNIPRFQHGTMDGWEIAPLEAGKLDIMYIPAFEPLTDLAVPIDARFPAGWENYAALHVGVALLIKEESDPTALASMLAAKKEQILLAAQPLDNSQVDKVVDTGGRFYPIPWSRRLDVIPNYHYRMQGQRLYVLQPDVRGF